MADPHKRAGDGPDATLNLQGVESIRIPAAPHLETVIRAKAASFVIDDGDGPRSIVVRNAVIHIEGDVDAEATP